MNREAQEITDPQDVGLGPSTPLEDWWNYTIAPLNRKSEFIKNDEGEWVKGDRAYFGGRPGLDVADPFDLAYSLFSSVYRGLDSAFIAPLIKGAVKLSGDIAPHNIKSQQAPTGHIGSLCESCDID